MHNLVDQVGFTEYANQVFRVVENGESTDVVLRQELDCIGDIGAGTGGHDIADHDIDSAHAPSSAPPQIMLTNSR
jgi:hypothetical protein